MIYMTWDVTFRSASVGSKTNRIVFENLMQVPMDISEKLVQHFQRETLTRSRSLINSL